MPYMGRLDQMTNVTGQDVVFELPLLVGHTVREALWVLPDVVLRSSRYVLYGYRRDRTAMQSITRG